MTPWAAAALTTALWVALIVFVFYRR